MIQFQALSKQRWELHHLPQPLNPTPGSISSTDVQTCVWTSKLISSLLCSQTVHSSYSQFTSLSAHYLCCPSYLQIIHEFSSSAPPLGPLWSKLFPSRPRDHLCRSSLAPYPSYRFLAQNNTALSRTQMVSCHMPQWLTSAEGVNRVISYRTRPPSEVSRGLRPPRPSADCLATASVPTSVSSVLCFWDQWAPASPGHASFKYQLDYDWHGSCGRCLWADRPPLFAPCLIHLQGYIIYRILW